MRRFKMYQNESLCSYNRGTDTVEDKAVRQKFHLCEFNLSSCQSCIAPFVRGSNVVRYLYKIIYRLKSNATLYTKIINGLVATVTMASVASVDNNLIMHNAQCTCVS